ncbi:MAG: DNA replication/repair protein RecF [Azospirillum brasilense]|nr:MAG: DNA replication/repair protein RecF [Azospirillum brasilense]
MFAAPHAITALTFENFRNYRQLQLHVKPQPVVLTGHNGAGKTNILEAISLLSPGRGMRAAKLRDMDSMQAPGAAWVVAAEVTSHGVPTFIGMGRDAEAGNEKRILKINGERERKHARLAEYACVQWLTPSMDQVFMEGGTARRKLLDRIVYGFEPEHATRVAAYEASMRERNRLLSNRAGADPYWLSVLEQQMAEHAVAITLARLENIRRLQEHLAEPLAGFPRAQIALQGALESWLEEGLSALDAEAKLAARLRELRGIDGAAGRATEGAHRSHWHVIHHEKNMLVERCSTGEQKAVLLSLVLAAARARAAWCGQPPILLLDEVVAHLDVDKRRRLFDLIQHARIQAWMTGTDAADFQGLGRDATHLEISGGTVRIRDKNHL